MPILIPRSIRILVLALGVAGLLPAVATANWVGGITFDHPSPSYLSHDEYVGVTIDCNVTEVAGARLYAVPYTTGSPTPGYGYTGGSVPAGVSTTTRFFRVSTGEQVVDHVKIVMRTEDNSEVLLELYVRVKYVYGPCGIFNITLSHGDHSILAYGTDLDIGFDYDTSGTEDVRIFARPYFDGIPVSGYSASSGYIGGPVGSGTQHFDFWSDDHDINQIHFKITNMDQTEILLEFDHTAHYHWREVGIMNLSFTPGSPALVPVVDFSFFPYEFVDMDYDYENPTGAIVRMWTHPYFDGVFAIHGEFTGSPALGPGSGSETSQFGASDQSHVNQVRILVKSDDNLTTYADVLVPVDYEFGNHVVRNITLSPEPPALLDFGEFLDIDFDYWSNHDGEIRILARPMSDGALNTAYQASGSVPLTTPTGSDSEYFRLADTASDLEVDQIRFQIGTEEGTPLETHYVDIKHLWGGSGTVSPVPGIVPGALVLLERNYPNPFNPATIIPLTLSDTRHVRLAVYDLRGRLVRVIADEMMGAGRHEIPFDGTGLPSGAYHYRLEGAGSPKSGSMMLVK